MIYYSSMQAITEARALAKRTKKTAYVMSLRSGYVVKRQKTEKAGAVPLYAVTYTGHIKTLKH